MASTHIDIVAGASPQGNEVLQAVRQLQSTADLVAKLKAVFDQIAFGDDWDAVAAKLGTSSADAETVYNLLGSVNSALSVPDVVQFLSRLG